VEEVVPCVVWDKRRTRGEHKVEYKIKEMMKEGLAAGREAMLALLYYLA
jgi:hypothetical protein